jgi:hypothetical protein
MLSSGAQTSSQLKIPDEHHRQTVGRFANAARNGIATILMAAADVIFSQQAPQPLKHEQNWRSRFSCVGNRKLKLARSGGDCGATAANQSGTGKGTDIKMDANVANKVSQSVTQKPESSSQSSSVSIQPVRRLLLLTIVWAIDLPHAFAEVRLNYEPPEFLDGPVVENSMLGTTFAYRARDIYDTTTLQITIVALPEAALSAGEFSTEHCIQLFLTEVAQSQPRFFAIPVERSLQAGGLLLEQVRWMREDTSPGMTGVTSCGLYDDRYVSINFQDSLKRASNTFPAIRESLKTLDITE